MPDLPFRIIVTDAGTAVVQRFAAAARRVGGVGRTAGRLLSRGFGLAQGAITGAVSRVFNLRNALLGLGVGLAIRKIVDVFGGFEKQMNTVRVLTGATTAEFEALTEQAKQLGLTTQFSAKQAAEGMNFLAKAGFEADEVLTALPDTLTLAAAANLDLASAADIVTNILTGLQLPIEDLTSATDVLTEAFTSSNTDLAQLGQAFKFAGPLATTAGLEFEEVATVLAFLGNAGIQASMAGTTLRGALAQLLKPSREGAAVLDRLGVTVKTAEGNLRPFADIIEDLQPIAGNASDILAVFGRRASGIANVLKQGSTEFRKFRDNLRNSAGRAAEVAAAQMQGLTGAIRLMQSAIEGAVIEIGEEFAPALIKAANAMAQLGQNTGIAIQAISEASEAAGDASRNAFLGFIPDSETMIRAIARVNKSWLELQIIARLVQRSFLNLALSLNQNVFGPIRSAVLNLGSIIALTFDLVRRTVAQALAFIIGKLAEFASASAKAVKALPTDAAAALSKQLTGLAISARLSQAQLKNVSESSAIAAKVLAAQTNNTEAQAEGEDRLTFALERNAEEIEKNLTAIARLDQRTGFAINRSRQLTKALNKQTQATKDVSAATKQAAADAEKAGQTLARISAFLAFDIDPSTGFGEIQSQLALIGPNAVKAGQDVEAAFEKVRASGKAIPPEQFDVIQKQTDQLRELIRIFALLPESARASFDGQVAAIVKGTEAGSAVLKKSRDDDLRDRLRAASVTLNATASLFSALGNLAETAGGKSFETQKKFRIAEAIINGAAGVARAFADVPFPLNFVVAAAIAANTIAQVRKIQATQPGGGGGGGGGGGLAVGGGGGGGGQPGGLVVPAEQEEQARGQMITISVAGFIGNEFELASQLSNLIREAQGDDVDFGLNVETSR